MKHQRKFEGCIAIKMDWVEKIEKNYERGYILGETWDADGEKKWKTAMYVKKGYSRGQTIEYDLVFEWHSLARALNHYYSVLAAEWDNVWKEETRCSI